MSAAIPVIAPDTFARWGRSILWMGLGAGALLILAVAWKAPDALVVIPALLAGGVVAVYLFHHPTLNLFCVLGCYVLVVNNTEGFDIAEVVYGLYYVSFLGYWLIRRVLLEQTPLIKTTIDRALVLFFGCILLSMPLSFVFGASLKQFASELSALLFLLFYFPVKDLCKKDERYAFYILWVIIGLASFVVIRNFMDYQSILRESIYSWQVSKGRVDTNNPAVVGGMLLTFVFLIYTQNLKFKIGYVGLFILFISGLILTQSRALWVGILFSFFILFWLLPRHYKYQVFIWSLGGSLVLGTISVFFLGDYVLLVFQGLSSRFASIIPALTQDVSMINRYVESLAVLDRITESPIIGHGLGVKYSYFDLTWEMTQTKAFIHNGYLGLIYRFGVLGFIAMTFVWFKSMWDGIWISHSAVRSPLARMCALAAAIYLVSWVLPANTANPFYLNDATYMFALTFGVIAGLEKR